MAGTKRDLLCLGKEIIGVPVQHHLADHLYRNSLFRNQLRGIQHVERQRIGRLLIDYLKAQFILDMVARGDCLMKVTPVEIRVGAVNLYRLIPQYGGRTQHGTPVKLHEVRLALRIHQPKRVHSKTFHHAKGPRQRPIRHHPHHHVQRLRHQGNEIPKRIVGRRRLRIPAIRLHLDGVDQVGELNGVLNKEHRHIVPH